MTISGSGFGDTPRQAGREGGHPESPVRRLRFITDHRQPQPGETLLRIGENGGKRPPTTNRI